MTKPDFLTEPDLSTTSVSKPRKERIRRSIMGHANQTPPAVTKANQRAFLSALAYVGTFDEAAEIVGIHPQTVQRWRTKSDVIRKKMDEIKDAAGQIVGDKVQRRLFQRALAGPEDPQSAVLGMFVTKRFDPRYRENAVVSVNAVGPVAIQLNFGT